VRTLRLHRAEKVAKVALRGSLPALAAMRGHPELALLAFYPDPLILGVAAAYFVRAGCACVSVICSHCCLQEWLWCCGGSDVAPEPAHDARLGEASALVVVRTAPGSWPVRQFDH
jgi:hypothetical protein